MVEPTGYTALDLIGFTDKGPYDPTANYVKNDLVHVGNSTWRCKIDDTTGITPTEGANWTIFIESATSLAGMDDVNLSTPKAGDGLVHNGNDWTNIPIMTKEQWKKNGAYNHLPNNGVTQVLFGLTFTFNPTGYEKGVVHVTGSKSDGNSHGVDMGTSLEDRTFTLKAGTYKILDGVSADNTNLGLQLFNRTTGTAITTTVNTHAEIFTLSEDTRCYCNIAFKGAQYTAFDDYIYPIITTDLNATPADYVPYAMTNRQLTEKVDELYGSTNNKISYIRGYYAYGGTISNILTLIQNFLTEISITNDIGVIDVVIAGNTPWSVRGYCFSTKDFAVLTAMRYDGSCKLFYRMSSTDTIKDFTTT